MPTKDPVQIYTGNQKLHLCVQKTWFCQREVHKKLISVVLSKYKVVVDTSGVNLNRIS